MNTLSEIQHDTLVELFNIGVGRAAAALSSMVGEEITLSVPSLDFLHRHDASLALSVGEADKNVCGVTQHFSGVFNTDVVLMFPEAKSLELVRLMVGESIPLDQLTEMEQEAMTEIGNVILNSCMGTMADILAGEMHGSLPTYRVGTSEQILVAPGKGDDIVIVLRIDFHLEKIKLYGHVAFVMNADSMQSVCDHIDRYLSGFNL